MVIFLNYCHFRDLYNQYDHFLKKIYLAGWFLMNDSITEVFVEQSRASPVSVKNMKIFFRRHVYFRPDHKRIFPHADL